MGFQEQGRGKDLVRLDEIGTAMISLEECCWEMQLQQQQQQKGGAPLQQLVVVPIRVRKDGWASDAMLYVNVELVDLSTPAEVERSVSFREKPRANPTPVPTMREIHRGSTYHEVLDLKQLLDLAEKQGRGGPESFASLSGAMSFDDIWREISAGERAPGEADVYIVSWNDHFFVLKAESDCYHVVDTLGERLFEGCDKAYMLRFDATSEMRALPSPDSSPSSGPEEEVVVATGKECCGEFIKRFLAAIPLREELHIEQSGCADAGAPHRRLQIEFHFTVLQQQQDGGR
uniref:Uncharacterized protein n=1 Tax=Aegilops tauschii TaxID=37682 RepID=M8BKI2_AEGTA